MNQCLELRTPGCAQPGVFRRDEPHLVGASADSWWKHVPHGLSQHEFRQSVVEFLLRRYPQQSLDQSVIQEGHARLDGERHRIAILGMQQGREVL